MSKPPKGANGIQAVMPRLDPEEGTGNMRANSSMSMLSVMSGEKESSEDSFRVSSQSELFFGVLNAFMPVLPRPLWTTR